MKKEKEVKLTKEDCEYYEKIILGFDRIEKEVATLEIAKKKRLDDYVKLEEIQTNFTEQIKIKYGILFEKGEIDLDNGLIKYEEFVDEDEDVKSEVVEEVKKISKKGKKI